MNTWTSESLGPLVLGAGVIFLGLGILPITQITLGEINAFLGKPLSFWQRSLFTLLGTAFIVFAIQPGNGILPSKPNSISFQGIACEPYEEQLRLAGERIFLRTSEFQNLKLPVGSQISLTVDVDGDSRSTILILDNDYKINQCPLLIGGRVRNSLGIGDDTKLDKSKRPVRNWRISS